MDVLPALWAVLVGLSAVLLLIWAMAWRYRSRDTPSPPAGNA